MMVLVLVLLLGLHWTLLQVVAWSGMVIAYSGKAPLQEAISMTFDGEHPCALCTAVKKGRSAEKEHQRQNPVAAGAKLEPGLVWQSAMQVFGPPQETIPCRDAAAPARFEPPPKPRPRLMPAAAFVV